MVGEQNLLSSPGMARTPRGSPLEPNDLQPPVSPNESDAKGRGRESRNGQRVPSPTLINSPKGEEAGEASLSGLNTWGKEDLKQRNRELSVLNAIARELNRTVDLGEALDFTLSQVAELLGLRTGWIWLMGEAPSAFPQPYLAATQNLPPALADDPRRMDGSGYCYCLDTYKKGDLEGAANVNVLTCSRLDGLVDGTDGLRYHASIPLYAGEKKLGVMNVASPGWRSLSPEELQLLYTIGDLLSIAVERARLFAGSARLGALEERNRLAREIHDTLAQGLTATALQIESADALLDADPAAERARAALERALSLTRSNLEEARRSVLDLRAAPLEGRPLSEALADSCKPVGDRDGHRDPLQGGKRRSSAAADMEVGLYRVGQEALNNVARHAGAARARCPPRPHPRGGAVGHRGRRSRLRLFQRR